MYIYWSFRIASVILLTVTLIIFMKLGKQNHNYEYKETKSRIILYFIIFIFYNLAVALSLINVAKDASNNCLDRYCPNSEQIRYFTYQ